MFGTNSHNTVADMEHRSAWSLFETISVFSILLMHTVSGDIRPGVYKWFRIERLGARCSISSRQFSDHAP